MAFLITFSVLLAGGFIWMGLFVGFREIDSTTLNTIAEWLSPDGISGWIFYLVLCTVCYVPLARRFLRGTHAPMRESDGRD